MTDKNPLDLAREWAGVVAQPTVFASEETKAAAEVIAALPDEWIDANKLREVIDKWEGREITSDAHLLYREVEALLPTPTPRTMAEIEWSDEEHAGLCAEHTRHGVVRMLFKFNDEISCFRKGAGVMWATPRGLTPVHGTRVDLTPTSEPEAADHAERNQK